jgi:hypothetical protein
MQKVEMKTANKPKLISCGSFFMILRAAITRSEELHHGLKTNYSDHPIENT